MEEILEELNRQIKSKAPSYSVTYNPNAILMDEINPGAFEIWADGYVHYRRKTIESTLKLIS